jgi:YidC/Oxa1 family membrane protein insertase
MSPVGLVQQLVEFTAATSGLPWIGGIIATTILMRTIMLPVVFGSMRNNTKLMNLQPEMQLHSSRMRECQTRNDHVRYHMYLAISYVSCYVCAHGAVLLIPSVCLLTRLDLQEGASRAAANLQALFKEHNVHPLKGLLPLVLQAPVFISFFMALRGMATLPVCTSLRLSGRSSLLACTQQKHPTSMGSTTLSHAIAGKHATRRRAVVSRLDSSRPLLHPSCDS